MKVNIILLNADGDIFKQVSFDRGFFPNLIVVGTDVYKCIGYSTDSKDTPTFGIGFFGMSDTKAVAFDTMESLTGENPFADLSSLDLTSEVPQ